MIFREQLKLLLRSPRWYKVRKEFLKNHRKCECCGKTYGLHVHHIKPVHLYPELELDLDNLITLCGKRCHFLIGHLCNWKSYNKDVIQDANYLYKKISTRPTK